MRRSIIRIDEEKCDGCGLCVDACAEGAIQIVDGKARLVKGSYCDGLGACIGDCPQGALTIVERETEDFDPEAVERHLARLEVAGGRSEAQPVPREDPLPCGCPGSSSQVIDRGKGESAVDEDGKTVPSPSLLGNWPVQIRLVPETAPYLRGTRLLISADCVPFAFGDFHRSFLEGRVLLIGCPKLDDAEFYREKLTGIFKQNDILDVGVAYMEVPCCFGLVRLVSQALADSGREIPITLSRFGIRGQLCDSILM